MSTKKLTKPALQLTCPDCGRRKNQGSMTWWIFAQNHCQCREAVASSGANTNAGAGGSVVIVGDESTSSQVPANTSTQEKSSENRVHELTQADLELQLGERYEILEKIGEGAFAHVYKIRDKELNLTLAAKVLRAELVKDDMVRERFVREANLAITLTHENLVGMYGYNVSQSGQPFIVMDCLEGRSLATILQEEGPLSKERFLSVFSQVLDGLSHAHMKGLIHRDIKPENIILVETSPGVEVVKLIDFGIAKMNDRSLMADPNLTQAGEVFGTPAFMSPEQCLGLEVDLRTDIYALGCVMHAAVEGKAPFSGDNLVQIIVQHLNQEPPKIVLNTGTSYAGISKILQKCMTKAPEGRYQDTSELKRDLELVAQGKAPVDSLARWTPRIGLHRLGALAVDSGIVSAIWVLSYVASLSLICICVAQVQNATLIHELFVPNLLLPFLFALLPVAFLDSAFGLLLPILLALLFTVLCSSSAGHTMIGDLSQVKTFQQLFIFLSNNPLMRVGLMLSEGAMINWIYHAVMESSRRQATFGESLFRLRVASTDGDRISFMRATIRHLSKILSALVLFDIVRIGIICRRDGLSLRAIRAVLNQPANDKVSGCLMLDDKDPLLKQNRPGIPFLDKKR